jgi:hypothetical protein
LDLNRQPPPIDVINFLRCTNRGCNHALLPQGYK